LSKSMGGLYPVRGFVSSTNFKIFYFFFGLRHSFDCLADSFLDIL
jgi:hypothetical protein